MIKNCTAEGPVRGISIAHTERTPEQIARDCRRDRIVDAWVSLIMRGEAVTWPHGKDPRDWPLSEWYSLADRAGRRKYESLSMDLCTDVIERIDELTRGAVIREIDAIATSLERRRRT